MCTNGMAPPLPARAEPLPSPAPVHADHQIMALTWNPPGTRMLSADRSGQVGDRPSLIIFAGPLGVACSH